MFVIKPVDNVLDRLVSINVADDDASEYDPDHTYTIDDGNNICKVSAKGTVYKCIANTVSINSEDVPIKGIYPPDYLVSSDNTYPWFQLRAMNRTAIFDDYINTQTESDPGIDYIETVIGIGGCDNIAFFNTASKSIEVTIYNNQGTQISFQHVDTYQIVSTLDDYFFTEVSYKPNIIIPFGLGVGGTAKIKIRNDGAVAKCGMLLPGKKIKIGITKDEIELPITDFSKFTTDNLGRTQMSEGLYADMCNFSLVFDENYSGRPFYSVREILISLRGKRSVWCVDNVDNTSDINPSLIFCGYFTDLRSVCKTKIPTCDIKISGVV